MHKYIILVALCLIGFLALFDVIFLYENVSFFKKFFFGTPVGGYEKDDGDGRLLQFFVGAGLITISLLGIFGFSSGYENGTFDSDEDLENDEQIDKSGNPIIDGYYFFSYSQRPTCPGCSIRLIEKRAREKVQNVKCKKCGAFFERRNILVDNIKLVFRSIIILLFITIVGGFTTAYLEATKFFNSGAYGFFADLISIFLLACLFSLFVFAGLPNKYSFIRGDKPDNS